MHWNTQKQESFSFAVDATQHCMAFVSMFMFYKDPADAAPIQL